MRFTEINVMDDISEHAVARRGDWTPDPNLIGALSQFIYQRNWTKIDQMTVANVTYDIARHRNVPHFIVGLMQPVENVTDDTKLEFGIVLHLQMSEVASLHFRDKGKALGYSNLHKVNSVAVKRELHGLGIAKQMYKWLVTQGILVLGDREQYFGARRLWAALSRDTDVVVDIIDYDAETVIDRDVMLHHGRYDHDFDQRVWNYGEEKQHIRLVLRNVI